MLTMSRLSGAALVLVALATGAAHAKPAAPAINQLAAYPRMSSFTVSPDGKHVAALEGRGAIPDSYLWENGAYSDKNHAEQTSDDRQR